jgi:zinc-ribbon domain
MPACRQCGKDNPEGTVFCGYCGTPLTNGDPPTKPAGNPGPSAAMRGSSPSRPSKPEIRTPTFHAPPPSPKGKGGFEWIPWSELTGTQRIGRLVAIAVVLFLFLVLIRVLLSSLAGLRGAGGGAPSAEGSNAPITGDDRKDGIESLCKVFQIYGLPHNDRDATEAAKNASELFKLAGNQSPERSSYILDSIVQDFRAGKLGKSDCEAAGAPLPTEEPSSDAATPDAQRNQ